MAKQRYYISVSQGIIQQERQSESEFTILATEEEANKLDMLMDFQRSAEQKTFARAPIPYKSADHDKATEQFSKEMIDLYAYIYELGDAQAKQHIEQMNILNKLHRTDYNHRGYETQK